jgi:hypothetical protein
MKFIRFTTTRSILGSSAALLGCIVASTAGAGGIAPKESIALEQTNIPNVSAYAEPAAGFDVINASDDALALYGFPPRPDQRAAPEAYKHWQHMVSAPQKRISHPSLQMTTLENRPMMSGGQSEAAPREPVKNTVSTTSGNWSGYAITGATGTFRNNNTWIFSEFVVPIAQQPFGTCSGGWDYSSLWNGFDGFGSGDVLQAGIEADAYCSGSSKSTYYSAWYEWYPYAETRISSLPVYPGDLMGVETWYTTSAPYGHAYLINYSTQQSVSLSFNPPSGTVYAGNSAEWVVEAPTVGGGLAAITNYVSAPFNFDYAYNGSTYFYPGSSPAGTTVYSITMQPGSSPLSYANLYGTYTLWFYDEGPAY